MSSEQGTGLNALWPRALQRLEEQGQSGPGRKEPTLTGQEA